MRIGVGISVSRRRGGSGRTRAPSEMVRMVTESSVRLAVIGGKLGFRFTGNEPQPVPERHERLRMNTAERMALLSDGTMKLLDY